MTDICQVTTIGVSGNHTIIDAAHLRRGLAQTLLRDGTEVCVGDFVSINLTTMKSPTGEWRIDEIAECCQSKCDILFVTHRVSGDKGIARTDTRQKIMARFTR